MKKKLTTLAAVLTLSSSLLFGDTLVTVNGHKITDAIIPPGYQKFDDNQKANLMEQLIKEELLYSNLLKSSIVKDSNFKKAFDTQKKLAQNEYKKATGKSLNKEQIRQIKGSIAIALYQQKALKKESVSNNEIKDFYNNNKEKLTHPDSIELVSIMFQTKAEADREYKNIKGSANIEEALLQTAKTNRKHSFIGWGTRENIPDVLFNKAFKYKKKRLINTPVKSDKGYHILYLINKKPAGTFTYNESKERLKLMIQQQKVMVKLQDKVNNLYGQAEIVY